VKVSSSDGGRVLRTLVNANVQFVVVGEPEGADVLRIVVSRHPTNLEALGRALDMLGSSLRVESEAPTPGLHRIGDPAGTVAVRTSGGDVDLVFGGAHRSLYADTLEHAHAREFDGTSVQWSAEVAPPTQVSERTTGTVLGRRLLSIAEGLAQLMERRDGRPRAFGGEAAERREGDDALEEDDTPNWVGATGDRPPPGESRTAGGAGANGEPGTTG
jgi:hypothetical protein